MTARRGAFIALGFAFVWLWIGASGLAMPWRAITGALGVIALLAVGWQVLHQRRPIGSGHGFRGGRFALAVAFEVVGGMLASILLGRAGLAGYAWPVLGIIVGLHFIGLWWATYDTRFLALTAAMVAVNVVALFFRQGGAAMLAVCGFGSATALAAAVARR